MNYSKLKKNELVELLKAREVELKDKKFKIRDLEEELEDLGSDSANVKYTDALEELVGTYQKHKRSPEVYTLEDVLSNLETISIELEREESIASYKAQFTLI